MERKYKITNEKTTINGIVLHRIQALEDFDDVEKGDLGGFIEKESNLSQAGNCWVFADAKVYGNAKVWGNASICNNSQVYGNAIVYDDAILFENSQVYGFSEISGNATINGSSQVYDHAQVFGDARIYRNVKVFGYATVSGDVKVYDNTQVFDHATVSGTGSIYGNAKIFGRTRINGVCSVGEDANISSTNDYITIGPTGSRDDFTTAYRTSNGDVRIQCGCYNGTIDEFKNRVHAVYYHRLSNVPYYKTYMDVISFIDKWADKTPEKTRGIKGKLKSLFKRKKGEN